MDAEFIAKRERRIFLSILQNACDLMEAERASIFLHEAETRTLVSKVLTSEDIDEIRIREDQGIAGKVFQSGEPVLLNDIRHGTTAPVKSTAFQPHSMICVPLHHSNGSRFGVIQVLNKNSGEFTRKDLRLLEVFASQTAVALDNFQLAELLNKEQEETEKLADGLRRTNLELQQTFRDLEQQKLEAENATRRLRRLVRFSVAAVVLIALGVPLAFSLLGGLADRVGLGDGGSVNAGLEDLAGLAESPRLEQIRESLVLTGNLQPLRAANVVIPFSGRVEAIFATDGQAVQKGDPLIRLNESSVRRDLRQAELDLSRAREAYAVYANWENSSQVERARRNLRNDQRALDLAERSFKNTEILFNKGIVSRFEYEQSLDAFSDAQDAVVAAEINLKEVLEEGRGSNLMAAELQLEAAERARDGTAALLERSLVTAPADGVLLVPAGARNRSKTLEVGDRMEAGMLLYAVGDVDGFLLQTAVDELDVSRIRLGQPVYAKVDAFPDHVLEGAVSALSSQANLQGSEIPMFDLEVTIPTIPEGLVGRVQIGMSTTLEVVTYENEEALVLSPFLVDGDADYAEVWKLSSAGGVEIVPVELGVVTPGGVEVLSGLELSDRVIPPYSVQ